ncbi:hypothetical protein [Lacticaseibacillus brantae]|uniref:Uncharacterized protein n=1 Tax=Lacticaseibacillus brantae DSM 23927 TaxID=1423727 RepID=A0A0R2B0B6_9LACO|nr:hypothetical protein [Lacticaseibacillus brantae]KRM73025.1 hypothetical protein FC34_GL000746 [Lacticaseibacillus brantae DSM 23927]
MTRYGYSLNDELYETREDALDAGILAKTEDAENGWSDFGKATIYTCRFIKSSPSFDGLAEDVLESLQNWADEEDPEDYADNWTETMNKQLLVTLIMDWYTRGRYKLPYDNVTDIEKHEVEVKEDE